MTSRASFLTVAILCAVTSLTAADKPAFTTLTGPVTGHLDRFGSPYLVADTISVPAGSELILDAGTVLLFKNFAGIMVHGKLTVSGTENRPVIFTSENDSSANRSSTADAAPYDWDGVTLAAGSGPSIINNCQVKFSLYGINFSSDNFIVTNATFRENGKSDVVIAGSGSFLSKGPWSYTGEKSGTAVIPPPVIDTTHPSVIAKDTLDKTAKAATEVKASTAAPVKGKTARIVLRIVSGVVAVGGVAFAGVEYPAYKTADSHFNDVNSFQPGLYNADDWTNAKNNRNRHLAELIAGGAVALVGAVGFTFSFVF